MTPIPNPIGYLRANLYSDRMRSSPGQTDLVLSRPPEPSVDPLPNTEPIPDTIQSPSNLEDMTKQRPDLEVEAAQYGQDPEIILVLKYRIGRDARHRYKR